MKAVDNFLSDILELPSVRNITYKTESTESALALRRKFYRWKQQYTVDQCPENLILQNTKMKLIDNCVVLIYNPPPSRLKNDAQE